MGEHFVAQLAALGFDARFAPLPAAIGRAGHVVAEHKGTKGKRVLLIGHLDTVFPGGEFRREGDIAHGAGVADMKGGDVVIIAALRALAATGALADAQIIVVMTGDEEAAGRPHEVSRRDLWDAAAAQRPRAGLRIRDWPDGHRGAPRQHFMGADGAGRDRALLRGSSPR